MAERCDDDEDRSVNKHLNKVRTKWNSEKLRSELGVTLRRNAPKIAEMWLTTCARKSSMVGAPLHHVAQFVLGLAKSKPQIEWRRDRLYLYDMGDEYGINISDVHSTSLFEVMACLSMMKWFAKHESDKSFCYLGAFKHNDAVPHNEIVRACFDHVFGTLKRAVRSDHDATLVKSLVARVFGNEYVVAFS